MTKQANVFPLRLPNSLKAAVARICREDGTSINQFVTTAVAEKVSAMKTAEFFAARAAAADIDAALRLLRRDGGQPPDAQDRLGAGSGTSPDPEVAPAPSIYATRVFLIGINSCRLRTLRPALGSQVD